MFDQDSSERTMPAPLYSWGERLVQPSLDFGLASRETNMLEST